MGEGKGGIDHLVMSRYIRIYMSIYKQCHNLRRVKKGSDCGIVALMESQMIGHIDRGCGPIRNIYTDTEERFKRSKPQREMESKHEERNPQFWSTKARMTIGLSKRLTISVTDVFLR